MRFSMRMSSTYILLFCSLARFFHAFDAYVVVWSALFCCPSLHLFVCSFLRCVVICFKQSQTLIKTQNEMSCQQTRINSRMNESLTNATTKRKYFNSCCSKMRPSDSCASSCVHKLLFSLFICLDSSRAHRDSAKGKGKSKDKKLTLLWCKIHICRHSILISIEIRRQSHIFRGNARKLAIEDCEASNKNTYKYSFCSVRFSFIC